MPQLYDQISGGSFAPMAWFASLPSHVQRLYNCKSTFSHQPTAMVVLAEVVCEAFTVWALGELYKKKHVEELWKEISAGNKIRRFQDICNDDVRKIYTALSGDPIIQADFWVKLKAHSNRRNALVHPDHTSPAPETIPSAPEAEESFTTVLEYMHHVYAILNSI